MFKAQTAEPTTVTMYSKLLYISIQENNQVLVHWPDIHFNSCTLVAFAPELIFGSVTSIIKNPAEPLENLQ